MKMRRLIVEAIKKSDLSPMEKLRARMLLAVVPGASDAIADFIAGKAETTTEEVTEMADGRIIELILQYLPEIMELIQLLFGMFS